MGLLSLFKSAVTGQRFRPADFNGNMIQIETQFNAHEGAGGAVHANAVAAGAAGFMSGADKTKLDGIATGAEVNQNAVAAFSVSGQDTVTAAGKTQTVELVAGANITLLTDNTTKQVQISASGTISTNADGVAVADVAGLYAGTNAEAIFAEIAGAGRTTETLKGLADEIDLKAPSADPTFTGASTLPVGFVVANVAADDESTKIANTNFVEERAKRIRATPEVTASKTLALTDAGRTIPCNHAHTQINITVPPNSSVAFPDETTIILARTGVADVAVVAGPGVTINSADSYKKINKQYETMALYKLAAADTWLLYGALKA